MGVLCIIALFDSDDIQHGAGVLLVTADLFRLYRVNYHQLNMYRTKHGHMSVEHGDTHTHHSMSDPHEAWSHVCGTRGHTHHSMLDPHEAWSHVCGTLGHTHHSMLDPHEAWSRLRTGTHTHHSMSDPHTVIKAWLLLTSYIAPATGTYTSFTLHILSCLCAFFT